MYDNNNKNEHDAEDQTGSDTSLVEKATISAEEEKETSNSSLRNRVNALIKMQSLPRIPVAEPPRSVRVRRAKSIRSPTSSRNWIRRFR